MNTRALQQMYQAWQQDNEDYIYRWVDFIEHAARILNQQQDEIMRELQKCAWFIRGDK
jgi:predicted transposase YbfD/YdcC